MNPILTENFYYLRNIILRLFGFIHTTRQDNLMLTFLPLTRIVSSMICAASGVAPTAVLPVEVFKKPVQPNGFHQPVIHDVHGLFWITAQHLLPQQCVQTACTHFHHISANKPINHNLMLSQMRPNQPASPTSCNATTGCSTNTRSLSNNLTTPKTCPF